MKQKLIVIALFISVLGQTGLARGQDSTVSAEKDQVTSEMVEGCRHAKKEMKKQCEQMRKSCRKNMDKEQCHEKMREMMDESMGVEKE